MFSMQRAVYKSPVSVDPQGAGLKARWSLPTGTILEDPGPVWVDGEPPQGQVGVSEEYVSGRGGHFRLRVGGALVLSYFFNEARRGHKPNVEWRADCSQGRFQVRVIRAVAAHDELLVKYR